MAIEIIAKIKQKNNGTFKLVDACDVEMSNGQDLETYLQNFNVSEGDHECDPEIYIGSTPPTDPNVKIWIDTSDQLIDSNFSSLVIQEFRDIISSLNDKISVLEKEVAYLKAVIDGGNIPSEPDLTNDTLLVNENGFLLVNENGQILCANVQAETITSARIMTNEDGKILTNENGDILCLDAYNMLLVNEDDKVLVNENNQILKL